MSTKEEKAHVKELFDIIGEHLEKEIDMLQFPLQHERIFSYFLEQFPGRVKTLVNGLVGPELENVAQTPSVVRDSINRKAYFRAVGSYFENQVKKYELIKKYGPSECDYDQRMARAFEILSKEFKQKAGLVEKL